jgi:serine protease Do
MDDIKLLDAVERYIRGEMKPDERLHFENLRKTNPEIDQLVVEHTLFLQQMNHFGERKSFRSSLNEVHTDLTEQGKIDSMKRGSKGKLIYLWKRYRRVTAIAASIAIVTTLAVSALVWTFTPKAPVAAFDDLKKDLRNIDRKVNTQEVKNKYQDGEINKVKSAIPTNPNTYTSGGTGFIIDVKGYLITNAHVVEKAKNIAVANNRGDYVAKVVYYDRKKDIAILKIDDDNFKPYTSIPYSINRNAGQLAEPVFTLGYPRINEVVYSQGYLSARTGYNGDTLSFQMDIAANHGNSGSPIFNKNGEVIGIFNGRQTNTVGFAFAIHSKNIYRAIDELKKEDSTYQRIKLSSKSNLIGVDRPEQVKKSLEYVYQVNVVN